MGFLMKGKLVRAKSVLWCSHCRIHRYVAAPFKAFATGYESQHYQKEVGTGALVKGILGCMYKHLRCTSTYIAQYCVCTKKSIKSSQEYSSGRFSLRVNVDLDSGAICTMHKYITGTVAWQVFSFSFTVSHNCPFKESPRQITISCKCNVLTYRPPPVHKQLLCMCVNFLFLWSCINKSRSTWSRELMPRGKSRL